MATPAYCLTTLKIDMAARPSEITISCKGKITAESAEMFQREVRNHAIDGKGFLVPTRIVLDLSNVTRIDNAGMEALMAVCAKGQNRSCSVEVINNTSQAPEPRPLSNLSKLNLMFRKLIGLAACE